jgi:magnesium transporter
VDIWRILKHVGPYARDVTRRVEVSENMLRIFNTVDGQVEQVDAAEDGSWVCLSDPTDVELATISQETGVDLADLRAPLDDEERSRVDSADDYTMIIVDIPTVEEQDGRDHYETIPLSIVVTEKLVITVCMRDTPVLHPFMEGTIRGFNTYMKSRFVLQVLYRNATMYLRYLRVIDRNSDNLELKLQHSMQNREILQLLELSKTLVYFTTSLKSNELVMERLRILPRVDELNERTHRLASAVVPNSGRIRNQSLLRLYEDDEDLLDDVITENKQAIEMANIYSGVLTNMTDASASIVSNNLNNVMRIFTIISIVLSIPTLIFSMYGMNFQDGMFGMPFTNSKWGFFLVIFVSMVITGIVAWWLTKSRLFK